MNQARRAVLLNLNKPSYNWWERPYSDIIPTHGDAGIEFIEVHCLGGCYLWFNAEMQTWRIVSAENEMQSISHPGW